MERSSTGKKATTRRVKAKECETLALRLCGTAHQASFLTSPVHFVPGACLKVLLCGFSAHASMHFAVYFPTAVGAAGRRTRATPHFKVRILITASIRKGTCSQRSKSTTDKHVCMLFFFIRRCLEVKARGRTGKDSACPFPVSAPLCGAFSYAPVVNSACSTSRQVCYL